ncbi:hypothetical protein DUNSADRAFT_18482 [Dunaliella salina]|uniref:Uncharacterized protein n=1 Tax=Dunaliella salina TaxID=3046 RepID=A0ABQ7GYY6_DUNSA|nr:hypothetical protein DUNSADRAFT_18482 [Dunaliella salina]|eukprot:KAF5839820.1 hypothetical protein DUNSADRAFT_18482 [Dunaliella salina]
MLLSGSCYRSPTSYDAVGPAEAVWQHAAVSSHHRCAAVSSQTHSMLLCHLFTDTTLLAVSCPSQTQRACHLKKVKKQRRRECIQALVCAHTLAGRVQQCALLLQHALLQPSFIWAPTCQHMCRHLLLQTWKSHKTHLTHCGPF